MIKLTNREISNLMGGAVFTTFFTQALPVRLSYPLANLAKELQGKFEIFQAEQQKLLERFGDRDDKGNLKQDGDTYYFEEHREEFIKEFEELLSIAVELTFDKLAVDGNELEKLGVNLSAFDIVGLSSIIDFVFDKTTT